MQYDEAFLRQRRLLEDPQAVVLYVSGVSISCLYDRTARLVFLQLPDGMCAQTAVTGLMVQMLFDYAWILGRDLTVARTFGYKRCFRVTAEEAADPECVKVRLLDQITHSTLHSLFESGDDMSGLLSTLKGLRSAIAEDPQVDLPEQENTLLAQKLIDRVCTMALIDSRHGAHEGVLESLLRAERIADRVVEAVSARLRDTRRETDLLRFIARNAGSARFDEAMRALVRTLADYEWTLNVWAENPDSITPKLVENSHEKLMVPLVNLKQQRTTTSRDPRHLSRPNRQTGSFYTPDHVAHYIASRAIAGWIQDATGIDVYMPGSLGCLSTAHRLELLSAIHRVRILDLACGSGVLLRCAADWLLNLRRMLRSTYDENRIRQRIAEMNLCGVDIMDSAVEACRSVLALWAGASQVGDARRNKVAPMVKQGNSLISTMEAQGMNPQTAAGSPFCWPSEFPAAFDPKNPGFDIVISNPPYGNILGNEEKQFLQDHCTETPSGGRSGSWSAAAQFIAKSRALLNAEGWFGLIVPNSILRVRQFEKTRQLLTDSSQIVEIVDEGSPFENIMLETVSIFGRARRNDSCQQVQVLSRRSDLPRVSTLHSSNAMTQRMFILYFDELIESLMMRGKESQVFATRGRDLSPDHVSRYWSEDFNTPYASAGRSVQQYGIEDRHLSYADDSFLSDRALCESYESEFLIATKNLPYPRCAMKPKGVIHGGGAVRLRFARKGTCSRAMGVILNSELIRYLSIRYFTNYSQLTTCLNTGIMDALPIVYPKRTAPFSALFDSLTSLLTEGSRRRQSEFDQLNKLANALVYELYLFDDVDLQDMVAQALKSGDLIDGIAQLHEVREVVDRVYDDSTVGRILSSPRMAQPMASVSQMPMLK